MFPDCAPLGHGIGLRPKHYPSVLDGQRADWFEVISENFMIPGGRPLAVLERVRADTPVVLHGVSLSIGSTDALNLEYLDDLARLVARIEPAWVSDHLCWGSHGRRYAHDLLPLPYTEEAIDHVVGRVREVQDRLGRRILLENVSSYVAFRHSTMPEWAFISAIAEQADCGILLDVNNVFVSAVNHGFRAVGLPRRSSGRSDRSDPPGRTQRPRDPPARHPRRPGSQRGLGPLPRRRPPVRRPAHPRRVGRPRSPHRGRPGRGRACARRGGPGPGDTVRWPDRHCVSSRRSSGAR